jgi:phage-related holin
MPLYSLTLRIGPNKKAEKYKKCNAKLSFMAFFMKILTTVTISVTKSISQILSAESIAHRFETALGCKLYALINSVSNFQKAWTTM